MRSLFQAIKMLYFIEDSAVPANTEISYDFFDRLFWVILCKRDNICANLPALRPKKNQRVSRKNTVITKNVLHNAFFYFYWIHCDGFLLFTRSFFLPKCESFSRPTRYWDNGFLLSRSEQFDFYAICVALRIQNYASKSFMM